MLTAFSRKFGVAGYLWEARSQASQPLRAPQKGVVLPHLLQRYLLLLGETEPVLAGVLPVQTPVVARCEVLSGVELAVGGSVLLAQEFQAG